MIIGNGMLAKEFCEFREDDSVIIFASGVSNSSEVLDSEFERERILLLDTISNNKNKLLVYFSTCSMYDSYFQVSPYIKHKKSLEELIKAESLNYLILRLSQVLGRNNKNQLIGFLADKIKNNEPFNLYDIERNVIDIVDVRKIVSYMIKNGLYKNSVVNVANPKNVKVLELVSIIENIYKKRVNYKIIKKTGEFTINIEPIRFIINELCLFEENYIENRVESYVE